MSTKTAIMMGKSVLYQKVKERKWTWVKNFMKRLPFTQHNLLLAPLLHLAILTGEPSDVIKTFISSYNINLKYKELGSNTPLHMVVIQKRWELVPILVSRGADVNMEDDSTEIPLDIALSNDAPPEALKQLISPINMRLRSKGITLFHRIVSEERWDLVPYLVQHGGDINIVDHLNKSPLYLALGHDVPKHVFCLMISPENVNMQTTDSRRTPLHQAVAHAQWGLVPILISHGADINLLDLSDSAPLHLAIDLELHTPQHIITQLISARNINKVDRHGQSPLHLAAACGLHSLVQILLHHEADPTKVLGFRPQVSLKVSLKGICIAAVRRHMSVRTDAALQTLGLPRCLVDEVKMIGLAQQFVSWWKREMAAKKSASQD